MIYLCIAFELPIPAVLDLLISLVCFSVTNPSASAYSDTLVKFDVFLFLFYLEFVILPLELGAFGGIAWFTV